MTRESFRTVTNCKSRRIVVTGCHPTIFEMPRTGIRAYYFRGEIASIVVYYRTNDNQVKKFMKNVSR
jgi:hypothetical protein